MANLDFKTVSELLLADAEKLVRLWLPNGKREGNEWKCGNVKGDKGRSFCVNLKTGRFADFAGVDKGGDLIALYAAINNIPMGDALRTLASTVGVSVKPSKQEKPQPQQQLADEPAKLEEIPEAMTPPTLDVDGMSLSKTYTYRNENGRKILYIQRYDNGEAGYKSKKQIRPWHMSGGKLVCRHPSGLRPLWNLDELAKFPAKPIIITEGEKTAEVARAYFTQYVSTTWSGGTNSVKKTDWSKLANREHILIIPDADEAGFSAAKEIIEILSSKYNLTDKIFVVDTSDRTTGWDIADASDSGMTLQMLAAYIKSKKIPASVFLSSISSKQEKMEIDHTVYTQPMADVEPTTGDEFIYTDNTPEFAKISNSYFRYLGIRGEHFYFYKFSTSQILNFKSKELGDEGSMVSLAPLDFWEEFCDGNLNWRLIRNKLVGTSEKYRFDPRLVRKIGIWTDEKGNVAHLGDKLLRDDGLVNINTHKSPHIYEYCEHNIRTNRYVPPATKEMGAKLVKICHYPNWHDEGCGDVLAGWLFSSMCCASLRWRAHVYVNGPAMSGKTWMLDNIVGRFLGDFCYRAAGNSTEASIRQGLDSNTIPVIFDESEAKDAMAGMRREAIFELARLASSAKEGVGISKGSSGGGVKTYYVRSPFMFASINANMEYQDETRTTFLSLKPTERTPETRQSFREMDEDCKKTLTPDFSLAMIGRAVKLLPEIVSGFEYFSDIAFHSIAKDSRHAEQMSYMATGLWFLENDELPASTEEAETFIRRLSYMVKQRGHIVSTEERLINAISQIQLLIRNGGGVEHRLIGEMVCDANRRGRMDNLPDQEDRYRVSDNALRQIGIRVHEGRVYILNESSEIRNRLRNTSFFQGWDKILINIPGADKHEKINFTSGVRGHAVSIPVSVIIGEINQNSEKKIDRSI